jgi:acetyl/propionyl-CoA carboxylase alpha subunit
VTGSTREQAVSRMVQVLKACKVFGPPNNLAYLASICDSTTFKEGKATTRFLDNFNFSPMCAQLNVNEMTRRLIYFEAHSLSYQLVLK